MAAKDLLGEIRLEAAFLNVLCSGLTDVNERAMEMDPDLLLSLTDRLHQRIADVATELATLIAEAEGLGLMDLFADQARLISAEVV